MKAGRCIATRTMVGNCLNCDLWDLQDRWETMKGFFITNRLARLSDEKQIGRGI